MDQHSLQGQALFTAGVKQEIELDGDFWFTSKGNKEKREESKDSLHDIIEFDHELVNSCPRVEIQAIKPLQKAQAKRQRALCLGFILSEDGFPRAASGGLEGDPSQALAS